MFDYGMFTSDEDKLLEQHKTMATVIKKAQEYDALMEILEVAVKDLRDGNGGRELKITLKQGVLYSLKDALKNAQIEVDNFKKGMDFEVKL